jgi:hypothetical protein
MPEFRCKMLNERGGTLFSADITAETWTGLYGTPPRYSTQAISPRPHGVYTHSKFGPARADCSLRH